MIEDCKLAPIIVCIVALFVFPSAGSAQTLILDTGRLTVKTDPIFAKIRFLNIEVMFLQGIELPPGEYHLEVSAWGYRTVKKWVSVGSGDNEVAIKLEKGIGKPGKQLSDKEVVIKVKKFLDGDSRSYRSTYYEKGSSVKVIKMNGGKKTLYAKVTKNGICFNQDCYLMDLLIISIYVILGEGFDQIVFDYNNQISHGEPPRLTLRIEDAILSHNRAISMKELLKRARK